MIKKTSTKDLYTHYLSCEGRVATDTRKIKGGELFFALKGEHFDGNRFAAQALERGAAFVLVDDAAVVQAGAPYLLVEDSLTALQDLARHHRRSFNVPVLAITGSNGKTTTKELVAAVLAGEYKTHFTQGNFNNHIGVPLTLLAMPRQTEIAVIEMGANHRGEIAALCEIAEPTHGLITNVGSAHIEGFGGLEGVRQGKSELYRYLQAHKGVAFINLEEEHLLSLAGTMPHKIIYKLAQNPSLEFPYYELKPESIAPTIRASFLDKQQGILKTINSSLSGQHNLQNINTAIAVGKYFKVPSAKIVAAIDGYVPSNNRSQWLEKGAIRYYLDAYNANPSSMRAALGTFAMLPGDRKIAVLGDMLELGDTAAAEHLAMAAYALSLPLEQIYLVGPLFAAAAVKLSLKHFKDAAELMAKVDTRAWEGASVMIKGSRGMRLEVLVE
jgi:UDP-N-acetylmuramoyl-tripeptide--D-alanyl-D-alanine ligase